MNFFSSYLFLGGLVYCSSMGGSAYKSKYNSHNDLNIKSQNSKPKALGLSDLMFNPDIDDSFIYSLLSFKERQGYTLLGLDPDSGYRVKDKKKKKETRKEKKKKKQERKREEEEARIKWKQFDCQRSFQQEKEHAREQKIKSKG